MPLLLISKESKKATYPQIHPSQIHAPFNVNRNLQNIFKAKGVNKLDDLLLKEKMSQLLNDFLKFRLILVNQKISYFIL
jgi:hypothetical protein